MIIDYLKIFTNCSKSCIEYDINESHSKHLALFWTQIAANIMTSKIFHTNVQFKQFLIHIKISR